MQAQVDCYVYPAGRKPHGDFVATLKLIRCWVGMGELRHWKSGIAVRSVFRGS